MSIVNFKASSNLTIVFEKEPFSAKSNKDFSEFSIIVWLFLSISFNLAVSIISSESFISCLSHTNHKQSLNIQSPVYSM